MAEKRRINIESDEVLGAPGTAAQQARDQELIDAGTVPSDVLHESPDEADVVVESEAERVLPGDIVHLRTRCEEAEKLASEEHESFLRTLAEYTNFKRRAREELEQARRFGTEDLVIRLLPIIDNFDRAIHAAEEIGDFDALHGGVVLILRQLQDLMEREGVKPIEAVGKEFDPNVHEAVMRQDTDDYPDNTVVEELQKGYTMGDKVIRPSMVKVARNP